MKEELRSQDTVHPSFREILAEWDLDFGKRSVPGKYRVRDGQYSLQRGINGVNSFLVVKPFEEAKVQDGSYTQTISDCVDLSSYKLNYLL